MHINLAVADYEVETLLDAGLNQSIEHLTLLIDSLEDGDVEIAEGAAMDARDVLTALQRLVHGLRYHKAECSTDEGAVAQ